MVGVNMLLAESVKFKHGLYESCGTEFVESIMLEPCLLQPCFHVAPDNVRMHTNSSNNANTTTSNNYYYDHYHIIYRERYRSGDRHVYVCIHIIIIIIIIICVYIYIYIYVYV